MNMVDSLSSVPSGIDHGAVSLGKPLGFGNFCCSPVEMSEQLPMFLLGVCNRGDMFARNDKNVNRRLRLQIRKCVAQVILIDGL